MKATVYKNDGKAITLRTLELSKVMESMKTETQSRPVTTFRSKLCYADPLSTVESAKKLPVLIFSTAYRKKENQFTITGYNGIVMLEINHLASAEEIREVKRKAAEVPQTLAAFTGSGGRSVKILVPFIKPDGTLPVTRKEMEMYHAHAYIKAIRIYTPQLPFPITFKEPSLERGCRFSYDPHLYYVPQVHPVILGQPAEKPADIEIPEVLLNKPNPVDRMLPGYDKYRTASFLYETSLSKVWDVVGEFNPQENLKPFLVALSRNCFRSGVPEEDVVHWTTFRFELDDYKEEVRQTIHNCYRKEKGFGNKPCISNA